MQRVDRPAMRAQRATNISDDADASVVTRDRGDRSIVVNGAARIRHSHPTTEIRFREGAEMISACTLVEAAPHNGRQKK